MPGETAGVAEVAELISSSIFDWFLWQKIPIFDQNFPCHKVDKHKKKKNSAETHPVDVVFKYFDPYLDKFIYLNTDLKSYAANSIDDSKMLAALNSLAKSIDCARGSAKWKDRYVNSNDAMEVRGLLFIYNHDHGYDKDFLSRISKKNLSSLSLPEKCILHTLEPKRIRYLNTVIADMCELVSSDVLPKKNYSFYYPDLKLHRTSGDRKRYPATIETLCSSYMIISFDDQKVRDDEDYEDGSPKWVIKSESGFVIYYAEDGKTQQEFLYLLDVLSGMQILSSGKPIRVRMASDNLCSNFMSRFSAAKETYVREWGLDGHRKRDLDRIEVRAVRNVAINFNPGIMAWRCE